MPVFQNTPEEWQRLDWSILQNGYVCLYSRPEFLLIDISWFRKERYRVHELDCSRWEEEQKMHDELKQKLRFKDTYASSFSSLKDSLKEIDITGKGMVLVLHHFDTLENETAQILLDILSKASQWHLLLGERLLTLLQVDDSQIIYEPVGARPVTWNPHEWLDIPL
ncbi:barstar family protein [Pontibacter pamirensis]|uniref:barstar family protein n=1 Tax=Pontibacter pamirensis TaxID=2562824 RepID=UPI001389F21A|nr:barstar family protein [Pontibacter pamirensis]